MSDELIIEKMVVNVHAKTHEQEPIFYANQLSGFVQNEILPKLERLLEKYPWSESDIELDVLSIDVQSNLDADWVNKTAQKISTQIEEAYLQSQSSSKTKIDSAFETSEFVQERIKSIGKGNLHPSSPQIAFDPNLLEGFSQTEKSWIGQFQHFLITGCLPRLKNAPEIQNYTLLEKEILNLNLSKSFWLIIVATISNSRKAYERFHQQTRKTDWHQHLQTLKAQLNTEEIPVFSLLFIKAETTSINQKQAFLLIKEALKLTASKNTELAHYFLIHSQIQLDQLLLEIERKTISTEKIQSFLEVISAFLKESSIPVSDSILKRLQEQLGEFKDQTEIEAKIPVEVDAKKDNSASALTNEEPLELEHSGMVLLHPFFPTLFKNLGFLNTQGKWNTTNDQERAIYTLNHLATDSFENTEDQLQLYKLLVGYDLTSVLPLWEEVEANWIELDRTLIEDEFNDLVKGVQNNWKPMHRCTLAGLRTDFLHRSGTLTTKNTGDSIQYWLIPKPHALDVLLPFKNWGISLVKFSWMEAVLNVDWK